MTTTIAPETNIGEITLTVADLNRAVTFYEGNLGFHLLEQSAGQAALGAGGRRIITLVENKGARSLPEGSRRGATGLYHFAVLLPDRRSLASTLVHLAETETAIQGASDHGVSEALYLADPDGNGIEIYRDRRRGEWPVDDIGKLMMVTDPLDIDDLILELKGSLSEWQGLPAATRIGHVHLHVRDIPEAEKFYTGILGFQLIQRYGGAALFVSAGGYHHHIGLNTWAGVGAPPPPPDAVGLRWFEVHLPGREALEAVLSRLQAAGVAAEPAEDGWLVRDPSQNGILLRAAA